MVYVKKEEQEQIKLKISRQKEKQTTTTEQKLMKWNPKYWYICRIKELVLLINT